MSLPALSAARGVHGARLTSARRPLLQLGKPVSAGRMIPRRSFYQQRGPTYVRFGQSGGGGGQQIGRGINTRYLVIGGGGVLGAYYVTHLERVPDTGRWRFMDMSESSDRAMGDQAAKEIFAQYGKQMLPDNHPTARYVQKVAKRLLDASGLIGGNAASADLHQAWGHEGRKATVDWRVKVIQSDERNAFVLPNGLICVFTGILPICQNEDALAAVLGHEISHQIARHSAERMSGTHVLMGLSLLLNTLGIDPGISQLGLHYLLSLPNSRAAESEADHLGLRLSAKACFDPNAAAAFWQRMNAADKMGSPPAFMSTHPSHKDRVKKIQEWVPEALEHRPESCGRLGSYATDFKSAFGMS